MKVGALILSLQYMNLDAKAVVIGYAMDISKQVFGAPLRTGGYEKDLDTAGTIVFHLFGELACKAKIIVRVCGAWLDDLCLRSFFEGRRQSGQKLVVAVNEMIAISYIEAEGDANAGLRIGPHAVAHVALVLGRTAAGIVVKAGRDACFDHAQRGIERIEIGRDLRLRRRLDPSDLQRLIKRAKLKTRHASAVLMSVDKTGHDPKARRANDGRSRILGDK